MSARVEFTINYYTGIYTVETARSACTNIGLGSPSGTVTTRFEAN